LERARRTDDQAERVEAYGTVWADWAENVPYLWIFHSKHLVLASDEIRGVTDFTLPDGTPGASVVWGSVFLTQVWRP
jgi:hypothetical protein